MRHVNFAMQFSPTSRLNCDRQSSKQTSTNSSVHIQEANGETIAVRNDGTELIMLGGLKYLQLGHWYRSMALLSLKFLFKSRKYVGQTTGSDQILAEMNQSVSPSVAEALLRREDLQLTPIYVNVNKSVQG
jgi:hypothetical protein